MRSVQFVLSWKMVFLSSSIIGILFCCMGLGTLLVSLSASQLRILYDGPANEIDGRSSSWDFMGQNVVLPCHAPKLPIDLEPPIQVYYEVKPFWQNYFSYMSSVVRPQLHGHLAQDQALQRCAQHSRVTSSGEEIFPCGLMATSDTFAIRDTYIDTESPQMPIWRHFENPPEYLKEPGFSWLYERYPKVTSRDLGVRSKRFIAWMCPNFLNRASKPYGVISEHLKKGSIIDFVSLGQISSSFPVEQLGARKTVLLTRGTQNYTLAVVLLVSGGLCFVLASDVATTVNPYKAPPTIAPGIGLNGQPVPAMLQDPYKNPFAGFNSSSFSQFGKHIKNAFKCPFETCTEEPIGGCRSLSV
eukprot:g11959.t1